MYRSLVFGLVIWTAVAARGQGIYDQPYDGQSPGVTSQRTTDNTAVSSYAYDDFFVPANSSLDILRMGARGRELGQVGTSTATHLRISNGPSADSFTFFETSISGASGFIGQDLDFTSSVHLLGGPNGHTYWISFWVDRPTIGGQWQWLQTTPIHGNEGYWQNPSGDLGLGTSPLPLSQLPGADGPRDLSFRIDYVVPEPSTWLALSVGTGILALVRRR